MILAKYGSVKALWPFGGRSVFFSARRYDPPIAHRMRSLEQMQLFDVNEIQASEIERVEVYIGLGQISAQYNKTARGCGVMLIWLRDGPRSTKR